MNHKTIWMGLHVKLSCRTIHFEQYSLTLNQLQKLLENLASASQISLIHLEISGSLHVIFVNFRHSSGSPKKSLEALRSTFAVYRSTSKISNGLEVLELSSEIWTITLYNCTSAEYNKQLFHEHVVDMIANLFYMMAGPMKTLQLHYPMIQF